uniref:Uncharacterized protein n=1 Tax=Rhizophora mucronata TaxID=61149 RepID=A0A2P2QY50_RHIMU
MMKPARVHMSALPLPFQIFSFDRIATPHQ